MNHICGVTKWPINRFTAPLFSKLHILISMFLLVAQTLADQEDYHEMAIFGTSSALGLDEKSKKQISDAAEAVEPKKIMWKDRDPKSLAHPNVSVTFEFKVLYPSVFALKQTLHG